MGLVGPHRKVATYVVGAEPPKLTSINLELLHLIGSLDIHEKTVSLVAGY